MNSLYSAPGHDIPARGVLPETGSPAERLATAIGAGATRLAIDWRTMLPQLEHLGMVAITTANPVMEHRKSGRFGNVRHFDGAILVLNGAVDLRIDIGRWRHTILDQSAGRPQDGLAAIRIFDDEGQPVFAIAPTPSTERAAWDDMIAAHVSPDQSPVIAIQPATPSPPARPDDVIDRDGLSEAWKGMTDVHQFAPMLRRFGVAREQAFSLVGAPHARQVANGALADVLRAAAASGCPIMVFVPSSGCTQIHTGPIRTVEVTPDLIAVRDPDFVLTALRSGIARSWAIRKPIDQGRITTLEIFDAGGECRAILCGQRDPGLPERAEWAALVDALPSIRS